MSPGVPVAVRSSATAEDLPDASFAGQQDTYLWIRGVDEVLQHVRRCISSLYTGRAIAYRANRGFADQQVAIAVGVQKMANSYTAGVMFTLHPGNGDRSVIVIDSNFGFGESVVSGEVTPDHFVVNKVTLDIIDRTISRKELCYTVDFKAQRSRAIEVATIPLFMLLFSLGGAVFGMAEETGREMNDAIRRGIASTTHPGRFEQVAQGGDGAVVQVGRAQPQAVEEGRVVADQVFLDQSCTRSKTPKHDMLLQYRDDLLDPEVPDPVHGGLGETGEQLAVGGPLDREGIAAVGQPLVGPESGDAVSGQSDAGHDEEGGKQAVFFHTHFPSR